jgi:hypothetical protein
VAKDDHVRPAGGAKSKGGQRRGMAEDGDHVRSADGAKSKESQLLR